MKRILSLACVAGVSAIGLSVARAQVIGSGQANTYWGWAEPQFAHNPAPTGAPPAFTPEQLMQIQECLDECQTMKPIIVPVDPKAKLPTVPMGPPTPAPRIVDDGYGSRAPGTFRIWRNTSLAGIAPGNMSTTEEPSCGSQRQGSFLTANWYAAVSGDAGLTWGYINPYDNFPADGTLDQPATSGIYCCDQVVLYVPSRDCTFWLIQYRLGNGSNVQRLAVANSTAALVNNQWYWYDWRPSSYGFAATGFNLDFPDLSYSDNYLYITTNIFDNSSGSTSTAGILRLPLNELSTGSGFSYSYYVTDHPSIRCTHGATSEMYFGAHHNTSTIRIYRWPEASGTVSWDDVGHTAYNTGTMSATSPDGTNFAAFADTRILGAFVSAGEIGFMWHATQGGAYAYPQTHVKRFNQSTRALLSEQVVYAANFAWMYPSAHPNAAGDVGGTIAYGGGSLYPSAACYIADGYNSRSFQPLENAFVVGGSAGPTSNRWGDYLTSRRNWYQSNSWVGTGYALDASRNPVPHYVWFGREANTPPFDMQVNSVNAVGSSFYQGAPISVQYNVQNVGGDTSVAYTLDFRASLNTIISTGDVPLGTLSMPALGVGATASGTFNGTFPIPTSGGNYYIGVIITASGDPNSLNNTGYGASPVTVTNPANDACSGAIVASLGTTSGTTNGATTDGSATCGASSNSPDVWYAFTPTCTGDYQVDTCGSAYDTVLSVHGACPGTTANQIACNDDSGSIFCPSNGLNSRVTFSGVGGTTYYIRVSGFSGARGNYVLTINYYTPNDACASPVVVGDGAYDFSNCGATTDGPAQNFCGAGQIYNDLWWHYIAPVTGNATATTCSGPAPGFDSVIAVYAGSGCPSLNSAIACNDDALCSPYAYLSSTSFPIVAGNSYLVRVGTYSAATRGFGTLFLSSVPTGCIVTCDYNQDGGADFGDVSDLANDIAAGTNTYPASCKDFNQDGGEDNGDVIDIVNAIASGTCP